MKNLFFALLILLVGTNVNAQSTANKYVEQYKPLVQMLSREFGIPPAIILGIALVESSSGQCRNCHDLNNHFGIVGRNHVARRTRYKQYQSTEASFRDFCGVLSRKGFYSNLKGNENVAAWVAAISRAGYSEKPVIWQQKILSTIRNNKL